MKQEFLVHNNENNLKDLDVPLINAFGRGIVETYFQVAVGHPNPTIFQGKEYLLMTTSFFTPSSMLLVGS